MDRQAVILVAAADVPLVESVKFVLELEDYCVRIYRGLVELLSVEALSQADCLIIDSDCLEIDHSNGIPPAALSHVAVPVILLTSRPTQALLLRAAGMPLVRVLDKPLLGNALSVAVKDVVRS